MAEEVDLSVEETNKLRLSLGLKPLNVGLPSTDHGIESDAPVSSEAQERLAVQNFQRRQELEKEHERSSAAAEAVRKAHMKRERDRQLQGRTLADASDEEDTSAWVRRVRKEKHDTKALPDIINTKPLAKTTYTADDLKDLRVRHDITDFDNGNEVILTLNDNGVLDEGTTDELINVDLQERRNLEQKLNSKKRKSVYTSYEDDEIDEDTGEKRILAQYDEDIDAGASKKTGFQISSLVDRNQEQIPRNFEVSQGRTVVSLGESTSPMILESDYAAPIKIKKPKKPKTVRSHRRDHGIEDSSASKRIVESRPSNFDDLNLVDDDDVQSALAMQRRAASRKRSQIKPDAIATRLGDEFEDSTPRTEPIGLVLDETTEFTRGLQDIALPGSKERVKNEPQESTTLPESSLAKDETVVDESTLDPVSMKNISTTGIDEEATLDRGVGAAMALLRQKGVFQENPEEAQKRHAKELWLANDRKIRLDFEQQRRRVKEELHNSARWRNASARERESWAASENKRLDALEAKANLERFKDYRPTVEIKYVDTFGRNMNAKEAFRHMSHQFHGKDSGSGKTAKKLAQIEKEKANDQRPLFK